YFANAVTFTSNSLVGNAALITKVYFPRLAIAVSPVLAGIVDFLLAASVLGAVMGWYGYAPPLRILLAPCFLLLAMLTALGVGLWLSALNVRYRDVRYAVPFLMQIWLFATPVAYPASKVHGTLHTIYGINPMAGVVEGFRWAVLGKGSVGWMLAVSAATSVLLVVTGALYFSRTERAFADVI
ncbi:MAG: lipopolysaccharide transport system permease protein, partial [Gaiellaceae bacterium]|nr:lipopolysaccharide transport system permease protein [Gaiellaceae bacterium]